MGVSGGAVFPPIQGALADHFSTRTSYYLVVPCFAYIALWAAYVWNKEGRKFGVDNGSVAQAEAESVNSVPAANIGLGHKGTMEGSDGDDARSIKEDVYNVEKA
jgi:FHS family L-fucose permease-like MFS transporter